MTVYPGDTVKVDTNTQILNLGESIVIITQSKTRAHVTQSVVELGSGGITQLFSNLNDKR